MTGPANPDMIRLARVSRGMHQSAVAVKLGIQQPTYSKIENGQSGISLEQMQKLADVLGYPSSFFTQSDRVWGTASPHHRKRKSLAPTEMQRIEAGLNVLRLNIRKLTSSVHIDTQFTVPTLSLGEQTEDVATPDEAARETRRILQIPHGPIGNMTRVLEDAGCIVVTQWFPHDRFDAISMWAPGETPVVIVNETFAPERERHTLAHELGHLVMHAKDVTPDPEGEADAFAGEFLMPADEIRPELRGLRLENLPDLKRRWRVSMKSVVYRARRLGEISQDQARYLYMRLNKEYGAKREPIEISAEPPSLLRELVDTHMTELGYSLEELAAAVSRQPDEFREVFRVGPRLRVM